MTTTPASNLFTALAEVLDAGPDRPCLDAGDRAFTRGELRAAAGRFAAVLRAAGIAAGERVMVQCEKSPAVLCLYLGCLQAGAVYVPLNTAYTAAELRHFVADAEPALVVVDARGAAAMHEAVAAAGLPAGRVTPIDALQQQADQAAPDRAIAALAGSDLAAILYTSGTTGRSKGAMLSQANLLSNALTLVELWGIGADDVLLHTLPVYHVHGLFVALHTALLAGARIRWRAAFDAAAVVGDLAGATLYMGVPTHYVRLLDQPGFDAAACAGMRLFISGSAPLLPATFAAFRERTGLTILERYGMTEAGMITSNPLAGERRGGTVGTPLPGVDARVADAGGGRAPTGSGVLEIRGPNVFGGYWRNPDKTRETFTDDGWFITGDVVTIGADGVVTIVGRARDLVISGGLNVYPREVEERLDQHPAVVESAVIGVPHPDFGEAVVAVVIIREAVDEAGLIGFARAALAAFKSPKRVLFTTALPRNAMGKVQKNVLREQHARLFQPGA